MKHVGIVPAYENLDGKSDPTGLGPGVARELYYL